MNKPSPWKGRMLGATVFWGLLLAGLASAQDGPVPTHTLREVKGGVVPSFEGWTLDHDDSDRRAQHYRLAPKADPGFHLMVHLLYPGKAPADVLEEGPGLLQRSYRRQGLTLAESERRALADGRPYLLEQYAPSEGDTHRWAYYIQAGAAAVVVEASGPRAALATHHGLVEMVLQESLVQAPLADSFTRQGVDGGAIPVPTGWRLSSDSVGLHTLHGTEEVALFVLIQLGAPGTELARGIFTESPAHTQQVYENDGMTRVEEARLEVGLSGEALVHDYRAPEEEDWGARVYFVKTQGAHGRPAAALVITEGSPSQIQKYAEVLEAVARGISVTDPGTGAVAVGLVGEWIYESTSGVDGFYVVHKSYLTLGEDGSYRLTTSNISSSSDERRETETGTFESTSEYTGRITFPNGQTAEVHFEVQGADGLIWQGRLFIRR